MADHFEQRLVDLSRLAPVQEVHAAISLPDEFGIEAALRAISARGIRRCYFLVNSPGGGLDSSYKIARAVRQAFDELITFVPHVAASGGTMLALTGDKIVMGMMSQMSPLDVQLPYKGAMVSAASSRRFLARALKWFETTTPEEAPYPMRALVDKLDPFLTEEWSGYLDMQVQYIQELLVLAKYDKTKEMAEKLVVNFPTHSFAINEERARNLGLRVENASAYPHAWDVMRYWLAEYMLAPTPIHCIRYALPAAGEGTAEPVNASDTKETEHGTQS